MFAEIILPLPLYSTFTYLVPEELEESLKIGSRVLVQFGRKKYYTGIVESTHSQKPQGYDVKPIMGILDATPIVRFPQLKLWHWIADYYLCAPGDVFKAAVPTGLKPESETFVTLNADLESASELNLTEEEAMVIQLLQAKKRLKISEVEESLKQNGATSRLTAKTISRLLELGVIEIAEKLVERYRAKRISFVELNIDRSDREALQNLLAQTSRSASQQKTLMAWLNLSGWMRSGEELKEVSRDALIETAECSQAVLRAMVNKGIFSIDKRSVNRFNHINTSIKPELAKLSDLQLTALKEIRNSFGNFNVSLLHGLTGSGKTEIYTHLMQEVLELGRQVLYLVPEISLTTQLTDRLRRVFGDRLLVYHSKFSDNERVDIWKRMLSSSEPLVILGVRSSIFLPFANLGLVIVDEEHEASFKQYDPAPRYNARDSAIVLASMHGAKTLLGSATPSVETYYKATNGKYGLVTLNQRFEGATLPKVEVVDMRDQRRRKENRGILSGPLIGSTRQALQDGSQAIIFQNRRGFAPVVVCRQCGWTPKCHNCDVSMVYHKESNLLKCHYCGFTQSLAPLCPACGQNSLDRYGYGTERIAEEVESVFEGSRVARMDLDTTRNKDAHHDIIEEFANKRTDILVGTQMVSKGLDFDSVRVVGVVNADTLLNFPDFRSNERAFNMLEQVAGRAGRRKQQGEVIIQTTRPDHPILAHVVRHDYQQYYREELANRQQFAYPPFTRIINVFIKNKDAEVCARAAAILANALVNTFGNRILGPERPLIGRIALWYIQQIMIKVEAEASIKKVKDLIRHVIAATANFPELKSSVIYFDVDPV